MKLSCCAYSFNELLTSGEMTLESFLDFCAEINLDGVDMTQYFFAQESDEYFALLKRKALALGLDISGAAIGGDFCNADPAEREKQIAHTKDWIVKTAKLGGPALRVFANDLPEGTDWGAGAEWVREGLSQCVDLCAQHGVVLGLENHHGLTADAEKAIRLIEPFADNPWVGLTLDVGNFSGDIYPQVARCAPAAANVHAKPTAPGAEGEKVVDYRRVVRILREAGYKGYLTIEYEEPDDPRGGVDRFAAYLRGCLADA